MKLHAYPLLLTLALPGLFACGKAEAASETASSEKAAPEKAAPVSPLVGTWTLDLEGTTATLPVAARAEAAAMLAGMSTEVVFAEDNTVVGKATMEFMGEVVSEEFSGTWALDGEALTATITQGGVERTRTGTLSGGKLTLHDDPVSVVLKR